MQKQPVFFNISSRKAVVFQFIPIFASLETLLPDENPDV
jgi:hypothetical protein